MDRLSELYDLGGAVVVLLLLISIVTLGVILYKFSQFQFARVGNLRRLKMALDAWDNGEVSAAKTHVTQAKSHLKELVDAALTTRIDSGFRERLQSLADVRLAQLERGFRFLDSVVQLSPLLGLFGTVLGMISAFQALQDAGNQVDPSVLAGGIWVALLTTAAGLAVAMPTAVALSWFQSRLERDRLFADEAIARALNQRFSVKETEVPVASLRAHGS